MSSGKTRIEHVKGAVKELVWTCGVLLLLIIFENFEV